MKRSHHQGYQNRSSHCNGLDKSESCVVPVLIEQEDNSGRNNKRPKAVAPLNLLIQAMMEGQAEFKRTQTSTEASSMDLSIASVTTSIPSTSSNASKPGTTNSIILRVLPDEEHLVSASHEDFYSRSSLLPLPEGRPLMPPPSLPTKLCRRQIDFLSSNFVPLEMALFSRDSKSTRIPKNVGSRTRRRK
eukprot:jgi/Psemu1/311526/fgenesh1_kg.786_\